MFGKTFRIQSTEKRHFKGQPHVNLSKHNYCIFYIHIFSQFSGIYRALYGGTPISIITDYKIMELFFGVRVILEKLKQKMKILGMI